MIKKLINMALVAAMGFALASCSEKTATGDATVGFESETLEVSATEFLNIPIYVTGTTSVYPVSVDIQVEAINGEKDVDFMVTSEHINIPAPTEDQIKNNEPSFANVEVRIPNRKKEISFKLTITSYTNAQNLGTPSVTVNIIPAKTVSIDALYGTWNATGTSLFTGAKESWSFKISAHQEGGNKVLFDNIVNAKEGAVFYGEYDEDNSQILIPVPQQHPTASYDPNQDPGNGSTIGGDGKYYLLGVDGNNLIASGNVAVSVENEGALLSFGSKGLYLCLGMTSYGAAGYSAISATK